MGLFISSKSNATRHGAYGISKQPPSTILPKGTGVVAYAGQFPWGPDGLLFQPSSIKNALDTMAPPGMVRTGSGYLGLIGKAFPSLRIARVIGPTAAKAAVTLASSAPANIVVVTAKYKGTAGNSLSATVANASDGDSNHFDLTVTVTGASGTSSDVFRNLNFSGVGTDSAPDFTNTLLIGAMTKSNSGRPVNGTFSLTAGTDGTVTSSEYVGTLGTGDKGIALFEGDKSITHVVADDCGNSLRAAVNAGLKAHVESMTDRVAWINGNSGLSLSATGTDAATYVSDNVVYVDPWHKIYDDTTGAKQLVAPAIMEASVAAQLSASTSVAWKATEVRKLRAGIVELEQDRGDGAATNTAKGVLTVIKEETGGFTAEAGVLTNAAASPSKKNITRTLMGIYIARSLLASVRETIDAPNVEVNQQDIVQALDTFLAGLKRAKGRDPNHTPHIVDYNITPTSASNSQPEVDAGDLNVDFSVKLSSSIERLFFNFQYGETVSIALRN